MGIWKAALAVSRSILALAVRVTAMHRRASQGIARATLCGVIAIIVSGNAGEEVRGDTLQDFVSGSCVKCHRGPDAEGGLDLSTLPDTFTDATTADVWTRVLDKVAAREMPPADAEQPTDEQRRGFVNQLSAKLHAASLARQQTEGRAAIRRMNRIEYENTLRDVLATPVRIRGLLPEDGVSAGFDNVSAGLETSAIHLVRFQEAVDAALAEACPVAPPVELHEVVTGKDWFERVHPNIRHFAGKSYRLDGDVGVLFHQDPPHTDLDIFSRGKPQSVGLYRLRLTVGTRNTGGRPLPLRFIWQEVRPDAKLSHLITCRDVPADGPTTLEVLVEVPEAMLYHKNIGVQTTTLPQITRHEPQPPPPPDPDTAPALLIHRYEIEGPLGGWPTPGYRRLFGDLPIEPRSVAAARTKGEPVADDWRSWHRGRFENDPLVVISRQPGEDAARLIREFLPRAFRRPADDELTDYYISFAHARLDRGIEFREAMLATYKAILCSPHFFLMNAAPGRLDDHALASRLSYFLWSGPPDEALIQSAAKGELNQPDVLRRHVDRLLDSPKSWEFVRNFTGQWLGLRRVLDMKPDEIYIEYDNELGWSLAPESEHFFAEMLRHDRSVTEFVESDWTFLNHRLARHYGIPGVDGVEFRKVALKPEYHRGGVMTHAGVLKVTANGTYTSPIVRGVWLLEQIIGRPPDDPPPDVAAIEPDIRGATTLREQIEKHRQIAACAACHAKIDPPGFALESYDVIGGFRTRYRSFSGFKGKHELVPLDNYPELKKVYVAAEVDPSGVTHDGRAFDDLAGFKASLLAEPDQIARAVTRQLLTYATGADIEFADREAVERIVSTVKREDYGLRSIIHEIVQSRVFRNQ